jgi:GNAT superfamily N-acetyltransferase
VNLTIRIAGAADVASLLTLYKLLEVVTEPAVPLDRALACFHQLESNARHRIYVVERDSTLVGTFALIFIPGLSHSARDSCVVEDVVVATEHQGAGIGKQMMRFAMAECVARHCYKLVLSSHVRRERAHRFYEALGFRKHGYSYLLDLSGGVAPTD